MIVDKLSPDTLCQTMNKGFHKGIPSVWRTSYITPKGKGSAMECIHYRDTKLMCHGMKLYERAENRSRETVDISSK